MENDRLINHELPGVDSKNRYSLLAEVRQHMFSGSDKGVLLIVQRNSLDGR